MNYEESTARNLSRRDLLRHACAAGVVAAAPWQGHAFFQDSHQASETSAVHNMLLVGTATPFLSHLGMFEGLTHDGRAYSSHHCFQVILEVTFEKPGLDAGRLYLREREKYLDQALYTLNPAPFVLSGLAGRETRAAAVQSFGGTVFRGHLERGGEPVQDLVELQVQVKRVMHFRKFNPADKRPDALEYILFGAGEELFAAHVITRPPDFDQILPVVLKSTPRHRELLQTGVRVVVQDRRNNAANRLRRGDVVEIVVSGTRGPVFEIAAGPEIYFEEGELMIPPTFDTTPEERRSGF